MSSTNNLSDLDKLKNAIFSLPFLSSYSSSSSTSSITSPMPPSPNPNSFNEILNDILSTFGLLNMPTAQKYGIIFGCLTFVLTVTAVLTLLTLGGSWKRIEEQEKSGLAGDAIAGNTVVQRKRRALLLERLLEGREWMMRVNYPGRYWMCGTNCTSEKGSNGTRVDNGENGGSNDGNDGEGKYTALTRMLMTVAPKEVGIKGTKEIVCPEGYEENYKKAYRRCQDKPGGPILGGRPNHRFEAYSRAYAGCGTHTTSSYRFSYARFYESLSGQTHTSDARYKELFETRPHDIIGRTVRLEPLDVERHADPLWEVTNGRSYGEFKGYDPHEVWGFLDYGPFSSPKELGASEVFRLQSDQAAFAIVEFITDRVIGVVHLTQDNPRNLSVQLELPIVKPSSDGSVEQLEACFLLMDRLFAYGYRRIQLCIDSQDISGKKLPQRLGFTQEGLILKHMIVRDANRDSLLYGMLNSDWDKGARGYLFRKVHGVKACKADEKIVGEEEKVEEEERLLREKRERKAMEKEKETGVDKKNA